MLLFDPFTDEYMAAEVAFYGLSEYDDGKGVKVVSKVIQGRCDDYLNSQFRSESPAMPILSKPRSCRPHCEAVSNVT